MDTIVSIVTPLGRSGVAILKISGSLALDSISNVFSSNKRLTPNRMVYGKILDGGQELDEVLVCYMKAPHSYTKEDVVEIYCHGNSLVANTILSLLLSKGLRLAQPGEFTKRAFINGRIDLTQAEAVHDLIFSNSEKSIESSLKNLNGFLKNKVKEIKEKILDTLSHIHVVFDYPEEVEDFVIEKGPLINLVKELSGIIDSYSTGKKIKDGIKLAIIGKPNVGKSSIMNRLLKNDRAIVTNIAGTTRDILEEMFYIDSFPIILLDTAGIRETENEIEQIGISLSKKAIEEADVVLFVLDGSQPYSQEDEIIYGMLKFKKHLTIFNKADLNKVYFPINGIYFSALKDDLSIIEKEILNIGLDVVPANSDIILNNLRHRDLFIKVKDHLNLFLDNIDYPLDISATHLTAALNYLGEIIGEVSNEDLLDNIFSNFCVGK